MVEERSLQDKVFIGIALTLAIILVPLGFYRILLSDWIIALFDIGTSIVCLALALNVYSTRNIVLTKKVFSIFIGIAVLTTVYLKGKPQFIWMYPAIAIIFFLIPPFLAAKVTLVAIGIMTYLMLSLMTTFELISMALSYVLTGACLFGLSYQWHKSHQALVELTKTDPLTNIRNRRAFSDYADHLTSNKRMANHNHILMACDIDRFKQINDSFGHEVGDKVLIDITKLIASRLRQGDDIYRIGGDEFIITLQNISKKDAQQLATTLCQLVESETLIYDYPVTISIGLAEYHPEKDTTDSWLNRADSELYRAKESGRNQVCFKTS